VNASTVDLLVVTQKLSDRRLSRHTVDVERKYQTLGGGMCSPSGDRALPMDWG